MQAYTPEQHSLPDNTVDVCTRGNNQPIIVW